MGNDKVVDATKGKLNHVSGNAQMIKDLMLLTKSHNTETLNDKLSITQRYMKDAYNNSVLSIGNSDKIKEFNEYTFSNNTLNWTLWLALYNDSWVFRRAIDKPAQDVVGYGINIISDKDFDKSIIYDELDNQAPELYQFVAWGALFGGSVAVMLFDDVDYEDMDKPIDEAFKNNKINKNSILKLYVTDRWYGVAPDTSNLVDDMKSPSFGKPKFYQITFTNGSCFKIHYSYILRYEHRIAPNIVKNGMLQGWGYAEGTHILNELSANDKLRDSIQSLIDKSLIEVIKMAGMRGVFMGADADNEEQLRKRLEMVNWGRNFNSLTFLDTNDSYEQNTFTGLTGLSDLLEKNMWLVAAALDMQGILYGDLKGGLSTDAESLTRYNEVIQNRKNSYYRKPLTQLLNVIYKMYAIDEKVKFKFRSLITVKEEDVVTLAKDYSGFITELISSGVLTVKQAASSIKSFVDKSGLPLNISDEDIEKLDDKIEEEMEDIDLDEMGYDDKTPNKKEKDGTFTKDMDTVHYLQSKYRHMYNLKNIRVAWYTVDEEKQNASNIVLTPSLYIFHRNNPIRRDSPSAFAKSIRFSDHKPKHQVVADIRVASLDKDIDYKRNTEAIADGYMTKYGDLLKQLYSKD